MENMFTPAYQQTPSRAKTKTSCDASAAIAAGDSIDFARL